MKVIRFFIIVLVLISLSLGILLCFSTPPPFVNPLSLHSPALPPSPTYQPRLFGFLPYWNLNKVNRASLSSLTDVAYFALDLNADGTIKENINRREKDPGWYSFTTKFLPQKNTLLPQGAKSHLVINFQDNDAITAFLKDLNAQKISLQTINNLVNQYSFDGLNLDFETSDPNQAALANSFTQYISALSTQLKQNHPPTILSLDVYANAASTAKIWNLPQLEPFVDYFIIMTYDYTRPSSPVAGPVAPIYPAPTSRHALLVNLKEYSQVLPKEKILIGIPLYGYEWQTESTNAYAPTFKGTGRLATLGRIQSLIDTLPLTILKDPDTLASRLSIIDGGHFFQIYFEDLSTLKAKAKLALDSRLGGLAFWAMGYENNVDIWTPIHQGLNPL